MHMNSPMIQLVQYKKAEIYSVVGEYIPVNIHISSDNILDHKRQDKLLII